MQLYFEPSPLWQPERFRYPAEQMMLMLFPGERPAYPPAPPEDGADSAVFSLSAAGETARVAARVAWGGRRAEGGELSRGWAARRIKSCVHWQK